MNKHIRAAFFDIDGTLLFGSHEMPDSTVQALHALQANGVKIFIATGRPPVHLPHLPALQKVNWDGYVTMNGQYCFMADGEVIYSKYIDPAALRTLLPYIEKEKLSIGFVEKDNCYFNLIDERSANFAKELGQGTADIAARIAQNPIYQLSAFLPDKDVYKRQVRNRILASSPPSSMMQSVPGTRRLAATRVAKTSCTKGTLQLSARPIPAEPEIAR